MMCPAHSFDMPISVVVWCDGHFESVHPPLLVLLIWHRNWSTTARFILNIHFTRMTFYYPPTHSNSITRNGYYVMMNVISVHFSTVRNSITARCCRHVDLAGVLNSIPMVTDRYEIAWINEFWNVSSRGMKLQDGSMCCFVPHFILLSCSSVHYTSVTPHKYILMWWIK